MKLKALGIECWLSSSHTDEHSVGNTETSFSETTGTTTVKTSVSPHEEPDSESESESVSVSEVDYYLSWRTSPNEPMSLWCIVFSRKPTGLLETVESKVWMCSSKQNTQQRSSEHFHEDPARRFRPRSIKSSDNMGTLRLEIRRLNGTVSAVCLLGVDDLDIDILDENPWIVFEFNFKRKNNDEVSVFSNPTTTRIYSQKRKRKASASSSASTSSSPSRKHLFTGITPRENTLSSSRITPRAGAGPRGKPTSSSLHSSHSVPALIAARSPQHSLNTSTIVDLPAPGESNVKASSSGKAKEPNSNFSPPASSEPNQVEATDDYVNGAQADSDILNHSGKMKASEFSQDVSSSLASPIEVIEACIISVQLFDFFYFSIHRERLKSWKRKAGSWLQR
ncbi:hypothetical protein C8J55DRAFT_310524 [Lentinula edodes]|uniref:Uncharacterized protein n=1 Tax=Lentinula lateritia TaxID=40482 RepID=A0A9W9DCG5_9AGAR|nr:hypothetical protein C8J55DRAFT_310524 [Lentinula edodes]